jgi:hypothetical protein
MKLAVVLACAACGASPAPAASPQNIPEADLDPKPAGSDTAAATTTGMHADHSCVSAGSYSVALDLSSAKITQGDTGMGSDSTWCTSMLQGVAQQAMSSMTIRYDGDAAVIEWPPGHPATIDVTGPCDVIVTSRPMPAELHFGNGKATGTTTFTVGTQHTDDTCTATNAKLTIEK